MCSNTHTHTVQHQGSSKGESYALEINVVSCINLFDVCR